MKFNKKRFSREISKAQPLTLFAIGIVFIFMSGYYLNVIGTETKQHCEVCFQDRECADNDFVCGDFGIYYFKNAIIIFIGVFGLGILISGNKSISELIK